MDAPRGQLRSEVVDALRIRLTQLATQVDEPLHLRISDLARSLQVSQTPVREAISTLEQEGLIQVVPHRGIRVLPVLAPEVLQWLDVREVLEGLAASLAAQRASVSDGQSLDAILDALPQTEYDTGHPSFVETNRQFHQRILDLCGNEIIVRLLDQSIQRSAPRLRMLRAPHRAGQSMTEHREIADLIRQGDSVGAERAARNHVRRLRDEFAASLATDGGVVQNPLK